MWGDPEERKRKKLYRIGKSAAYSVGGGLGVWILSSVYPYPPEAERMAGVFGQIGWVLLLYGITMLAVIVVRQDWAPKINLLMIGIVIPSWLFYIFLNSWPG